ncbi:ubiquinol-cytochrome c reductase iron-sulfur subunit [Rubellicoccus peritrichatus]|uniref:Rieske 2Fe-2S domain-containing protein n=1 Tax=Rubellicoccus peritrichatus TaxID=3080537 RepID=A0AAQ3LAH6_9BACT|nr:Rieske 2Fe-2S domain-containing protein [Puniceicoccus sp. CR14]WOO41682.1 Rieske 2Fe-2S domain-containing protein [Puniceicoccus sp. CR14]
MSDECPHKPSEEKTPSADNGAPPGSHPCCCGGGGGAKKKPMSPERRNFMLKFGMGLNVAAGAMIGIPIIGYLFSAFKKESPQVWISLGAVDQFEVGKIKMATYVNPGAKPWDGKSSDIPCWVRRKSKTEFQIFAINCTHLGCPVRWFEESKLFLCPCHGGAYYENGDHAAGPPPRGLYEYENRIVKNELQVKGGQIPTLSQPV